MINLTLRNYKAFNPESVLAGTDFEKAVNGLSKTDLPVFDDFPQVPIGNSMKIKQPEWGCMKGGQLPTYRLWKNQTQRLREPVQSGVKEQYSTASNSFPQLITAPRPSHLPNSYNPINISNMSMSSIGNMGGQLPKPDISINESREQSKPFFDKSRLAQFTQTMDKIKQTDDANRNSNNKIRYGKRKKTIRRTYKLGKSRITPKVSVLISNKTVRKNISTKTEKLKHIPIDEIRSVLIKKGFIKIGSLATNDVLRKMYESMLLVCGEVENHNPDNLLYNYFHA
jgi:hypothetical protein